MTDLPLGPTGPDEPERPGRRLGRLRSLTIDTTPLRESPEYRRLYLGDAVSLVGTQMTAVAVPIQVFVLTGRSLYVGLVSIAALVPLVVMGLIGGSIADSMDRRRLLLFTSSLLAVVSGLFWLQAALSLDQLWLLFVLVFVQSGVFAVESSARRAVVPRLIPASQIPAATALSQVLWNFATVVGPLTAGVIVGTLGLSWAYGIDAVSFLAALYAIVTLRAVPPAGGGTAAGLRSVMEGLAFLRSRPVLWMTFAVDVNAMVFGMPRALFPLLAVEAFHVGPIGLGFLYAAPGIGAAIGALLTGWVQNVRHQGRAVLWSVAVWGLAIVGFGLSTEAFALALVFLAIAGAADVISAIFRGTILQSSVPDRLRGRLSGIHIMVVVSGPRLGDFEAGLVAQLISPAFSVISGGIACVAGVGLLAALVPQFRRYHAGEPA